MATLELEFAGIETPKDGFLEVAISELDTENNTKKRKFNLVTNNSVEGPRLDDHLSYFKKLTENSAYWYQRVRPRKEQSKDKTKKKKN